MKKANLATTPASPLMVLPILASCLATAASIGLGHLRPASPHRGLLAALPAIALGRLSGVSISDRLCQPLFYRQLPTCEPLLLNLLPGQYYSYGGQDTSWRLLIENHLIYKNPEAENYQHLKPKTTKTIPRRVPRRPWYPLSAPLAFVLGYFYWSYLARRLTSYLALR